MTSNFFNAPCTIFDALGISFNAPTIMFATPTTILNASNPISNAQSTNFNALMSYSFNVSIKTLLFQINSAVCVDQACYLIATKDFFTNNQLK